jgi:hypothetical protein
MNMQMFAVAHNDISQNHVEKIENVAALQHYWCAAMRLGKC